MEIRAIFDVVAVLTIMFLVVGVLAFVLWFFARLDREDD